MKKNTEMIFDSGTPKYKDLSDFCSRPVKERAEVMRKILRKANEAQRKMMESYKAKS